MTDDDKPSQELTTQQRAAVGKSARNGVSGRLKAALDDMTWNGTPWEEFRPESRFNSSINEAGSKEAGGAEVFEGGERCSDGAGIGFNFSSAEIMRQDENRGAAVAAARTIETMTTEALGGPRTAGAMGGPRAGYLIDLSEPSPGVVINIVTPAPRPEVPIIDVTPSERERG